MTRLLVHMHSEPFWGIHTEPDNGNAGPYHGEADCRDDISLPHVLRDREEGVFEISEDKTGDQFMISGSHFAE